MRTRYAEFIRQPGSLLDPRPPSCWWSLRRWRLLSLFHLADHDASNGRARPASSDGDTSRRLDLPDIRRNRNRVSVARLDRSNCSDRLHDREFVYNDELLVLDRREAGYSNRRLDVQPRRDRRIAAGRRAVLGDHRRNMNSNMCYTAYPVKAGLTFLGCLDGRVRLRGPSPVTVVPRLEYEEGLLLEPILVLMPNAHDMWCVGSLKPEPANRRSPGRPRGFNTESALDAALLIFRERGYHATSLAELGPAMGITVGSIYKAFGDKRGIFLAAFDRYTDLRTASLRGLLDVQQTGKDKISAMLGFYANSSYGIEGRRGCLVVGSATELALFDKEMKARVTGSLQRVETLLLDVIILGQSDGSIATGINSSALAHTLLCLLQGFRVIGKTGQTRAKMAGAVDQALRLLA